MAVAQLPELLELMLQAVAVAAVHLSVQAAMADLA
jgi:hypothetical protein